MKWFPTPSSSVQDGTQVFYDPTIQSWVLIEAAHKLAMFTALPVTALTDCFFRAGAIVVLPYFCLNPWELDANLKPKPKPERA